MADGKTRNASLEDIRPGVVLREVNDDGTTPPFGDSLVVRIDSDFQGNKSIRLSRPFTRINMHGIPTLVEEKYEIPLDYLLSQRSRLKLVIMDRGNPANYSTIG